MATEQWGAGPKDQQHFMEIKRAVSLVLNRIKQRDDPSKWVAICALAGLVRELVDQYPANSKREALDMLDAFMRHAEVEKSNIITLH